MDNLRRLQKEITESIGMDAKSEGLCTFILTLSSRLDMEAKCASSLEGAYAMNIARDAEPRVVPPSGRNIRFLNRSVC